jgi:hypothetical protein
MSPQAAARFDPNEFKCPDSTGVPKTLSTRFPEFCRTRLSSKGIDASAFHFEDVTPARPAYAPPVVWMGSPFCEDIAMGECVQSENLDWVWDALLRGFPGVYKQDAIVDENKITLVSQGIYVFVGPLRGFRDLSAALAACESKAILIHLGDSTGREAQANLTSVGAVPLAFLEPETARTPYASKQFPVVVRQFWSQSLAEQFAEKLLFAPLGYASGFYGQGWSPYVTTNAPDSDSDYREDQRVSARDQRVLKAPEDRKNLWAFVGHADESNCESAMNAMKKLRGRSNVTLGSLGDGIHHQVKPADIRRILEDSIFCPNPAGWHGQETHRFSEAMATGCIPVVETGETSNATLAHRMAFSPKGKSVKSCFHFW